MNTKLAILATVVIALLCSGATAQTCFRQTCVESGELCTQSACADAADTSCHHQCRQGQSCQGVPGRRTCRGTVGGATCDVSAGMGCSATIYDTLSYTCVLNTCVPSVSFLGLPLDSCSTSDNCASSTNCVDGTCVGKMRGENCTVTNECHPGLWCDPAVSSQPTCQPAKGGGESCTTTSECRLGSCVNATCVDNYSGAAGDTCTSSTNCGDGLTCYLGRCAASNSSSLAACTVSGGCGRLDESCTCNTATGETVCAVSSTIDQTRCNGIAREFFDCQRNSGCHRSSSVSYAGSCINRQCFDSRNAYANCISASRNYLVDSSCFASAPAAAIGGFLAVLF